MKLKAVAVLILLALLLPKVVHAIPSGSSGWVRKSGGIYRASIDENATLDGSGNLGLKSLNIPRSATSPICYQWYAGTNYDDNYTEWCAPSTGYSSTVRYGWPVAAPAGDYMLQCPAPVAGLSQCSWVAGGGGGSMVYPGAGIANSTGSAWGTSYTLDTDLSSVSGSDDSIPSAKATKAALDSKLGTTVAPVEMTDGNYTLTASVMTIGSVFSNRLWTGQHSVILPECTVSTIGATTTILVMNASHCPLVWPYGGTDQILPTTIRANQEVYEVACSIGDLIKIECVQSGASSYDWLILGQTGNWVAK